MIPHHFKGQDLIMEAPKGYDHERHGECIGLPVQFVRDEDGRPIGVRSVWKPTPDQLAVLNRGGAVETTLLGPQPPMMQDVIEADQLLVPA